VKIQVKSTINYQHKCDAFVIAVRSTSKPSRQLADLDKATDGAISRLQNNEQFDGKRGQVVVIAAPKGLSSKNLV